MSKEKMSKKQFNQTAENDAQYIELQQQVDHHKKRSADKDVEIKDLEKRNLTLQQMRVAHYDALAQERLDLLGRVYLIEQKINSLGLPVARNLPKLSSYESQTVDNPADKLKYVFDEMISSWKKTGD